MVLIVFYVASNVLIHISYSSSTGAVVVQRPRQATFSTYAFCIVSAAGRGEGAPKRQALKKRNTPQLLHAGGVTYTHKGVYESFLGPGFGTRSRSLHQVGHHKNASDTPSSCKQALHQATPRLIFLRALVHIGLHICQARGIFAMLHSREIDCLAKPSPEEGFGGTVPQLGTIQSNQS